LTPEALQQELDAGRVRSAYLVAGGEALLRDESIAALRCAVLGDAPADFNFDRFEGDTVSPGALADALHMLPVFAARRLVWLREPTGGRGSWKSLCEALPALVRELGKDAPAVLVVSATSIDRRTAWVRAFGDAWVECEAPRGARELVAFVKKDAKRLGIALASGAAEQLALRVGASLIGLRNELEKASLLAALARKSRRTTLPRRPQTSPKNPSGISPTRSAKAAPATRSRCSTRCSARAPRRLSCSARSRVTSASCCGSAPVAPSPRPRSYSASSRRRRVATRPQGCSSACAPSMTRIRR